MRCDACKNWVTERKTVYGEHWVGGLRIAVDEIVNWKAPEGAGHCEVLHQETPPDFGCIKFVAGDDHVAVTRKPEPPWRYFKMIPCPSCSGSPGGGQCLCAGTGLTREYEDGYIGDERTRRHPKEPVEEIAAAAQGNSLQVEIDALYRRHGMEPPPRVDPGTILAPLPKADPLQTGAEF